MCGGHWVRILTTFDRVLPRARQYCSDGPIEALLLVAVHCWACICPKLTYLGVKACGWRSARPAGLHDAAAAASGLGLRSGESPRVVTRKDLSTRCYLRSGRTPVVGPASFAAPPWRNCRSKMQIIGHFFALSKRARNNHCGSPAFRQSGGFVIHYTYM